MCEPLCQHPAEPFTLALGWEPDYSGAIYFWAADRSRRPTPSLIFLVVLQTLLYRIIGEQDRKQNLLHNEDFKRILCNSIFESLLLELSHWNSPDYFFPPQGTWVKTWNQSKLLAMFHWWTAQTHQWVSPLLLPSFILFDCIFFKQVHIFMSK